MTDLNALVQAVLKKPKDVAALNSLRDACEENGYTFKIRWFEPYHVTVIYKPDGGDYCVVTDAMYIGEEVRIFGPHTLAIKNTTPEVSPGRCAALSSTKSD